MIIIFVSDEASSLIWKGNDEVTEHEGKDDAACADYDADGEGHDEEDGMEKAWR